MPPQMNFLHDALDKDRENTPFTIVSCICTEYDIVTAACTANEPRLITVFCGVWFAMLSHEL